ncbi:MAG: glycoside hydrolase family 43 protein [Breznakibacter sp.]
MHSRNLPKLLLAGSVLLASSSFKPGKTTSVAKFDYFSYKGEDDYYTQNPLPGNDYFYNPILPGWYSDPSICANGEDYFMVTSTFSYFPGVPLFHSKDLVNWKQVNYVLDRESQLSLDGQRTSGGIFAPAIEYNPANQTYYMITTNVGRGNFFVKTKNPFGAWSEPIWLPSVNGIDPSFFFDDNGRGYIVNNDAPEGEPLYDGHRAIGVQEFDVKTDKAIGPRKVLVNGGVRLEDNPIWIEGPHMYKINGKYYLMAAEGGTGSNHSEVILTGNSPMGEFRPWDKNPILTQRHLDPKRDNPVTCAGHADLIQAKDGSWWGVFLACRPIDGQFENLGRETFMMPVGWSEDGYPFMTQNDDVVPMIVRRKGAERGPDAMFGNFGYKETFDTKSLGLEWLTLRTSAKDLYSLTEKTGYLLLKCAETNASETKTPAYVCRRMQHHKFECSTAMDFNPANENEAAGMLLYKDEHHQYFLSVSKNGPGRKVSLAKISQSGSEVIASHDIMKSKTIQLKVVSNGVHYDFYYRFGKKNWELLANKVDARYLSTANAGGFTGTTIGLYATQNPK